MTAAAERDYILGTHDDELTRLGLQHAVWRSRALDAWRRARFRAGQTLLDVGCGPGYAAADLADITGEFGRVIAVDRSRRFLEVVRSRSLPQIETHEIDLDEGDLPVRNADGAWARWVFAFVRRPRALLERVRDALKPGGVVVIHEYVDYRTWRVIPGFEEHDEFVRAVMKSWRDTGGEPDIGRQIPHWLEELGFEIRSMQPIVDVIRPDDFAWQWPIAFMRTGLQRLIDIGQIRAERGKAIGRVFTEIETDPKILMVTPAVLEIIAARVH